MNTNSRCGNFNPSKDYYQKDQLDLDSWFQVTQIDYEKLIEEYSFDNLFQAFDKKQIELLDIGCGTAKFPSLLDRKISEDIQVSVDLLDISEYCLQVAQKKIDNLKYFSTDKIYLSATENLHKFVEKSRSYDVIWAIHSLCTIDKSKMGEVYLYCLNKLKSNGHFLIYQLSQNSCYYQLYDFYVSHFNRPNNTIDFLTSEDHKQILDLLEINYETIQLNFTHTINANRKNILEVYLKKCIFDNSIDVISFFEPILQESFDEESNQYKFNQVVDLVIIAKASNIRA